MIIPFWSIYPPMGGGKQRTINLLHQLCRDFDVTVIILQDIDSFSAAMEEYPALKRCTIFSTVGEPARDLFSLLPERIANALRFRWWNRSLRGPAEKTFLLVYPQLRPLFDGKPFDCVLLEEMASLSLARVIRRAWPSAWIVYDGYNVNTKLAALELSQGQIPESYYEVVRQTESSLFRSVDGIFACSEQDLAELVNMNGSKISGAVIPNGVGLPETARKFDPASTPDDILFCGSLDYFPNQEGLTWFCKEVFPLILQKRPEVRLLVVGKGEPNAELSDLLKGTGIVNYGMVDRVDVFYRKASLAVVPLLSGSGTRLKLLEAMGQQVAVVSTTIGAEGIDYTDKENILIADDNRQFADAVLRLLADKKMSGDLSEKAFSFVKERYDWNRIGEKMAAYFRNARK